MDGTLDHVMIRVADLTASVDWYGRHLDYRELDRHEGDGFTIAYLAPDGNPEAGAKLELTDNEGATPTVGDAWGHVAVRVPEGELEAAYDGLVADGVEDYRDPESCGGRYAFVRDPDGHEIELVQRDIGPRWSLDHTMMRVTDADRAIGFWTRKFGYETVGRWEADTFANYFLRPPDAPAESMALELTYNYDGRSYELADGWGHVCVRVDDLHGDWESLMTREAEDYRSPADCDGLYAFTMDPDGHEIELLERDPTAASLFPF